MENNELRHFPREEINFLVEMKEEYEGIGEVANYLVISFDAFKS